ncbi:CDP-diacylglycerol--glycerol-3-phosphate 3-phosphatidyltransferase [Marinitoga sp. 1135]|uniref:CDP-diacylglycerol--glycerol-3-phosphate 3-phosphatidyltransferase n=1 Tax=Marinitoga piezophila (strain DSM 14283 / JCM 11233 / KA3) TaxID=443254 RepID=H2J3F1_MARPK|nr:MULTISPECIES: CDP-diacylglycerol--glycerol-3-phosphate 3-phosphatidyltransferase [Marinitoga]AEX85767.1 CDP-diacylglycerol--glycerol-3-phosphate 3-phosphatidyltransferase [Marinitoga piezophila KA3]APT76210.1 CDP-diacylglycerol--glycerol-3-phosphate 3-phosphatidyltransferase [Marinitoga sp. 1137]NUU95968.1 CDP-diacylglycerol--glycerol-3-phosphate 3-phosphatidyltransferase [Marinitoga sp. 1135]NUU97880.1 CDP-diacylglycerol--glycerol-3-phosphate 3-phosphatidyltransferase [Marinitoga sp. 1138]
MNLWTVPNILTFIRIIATIPMFMITYDKNLYIIAFFVYILVSLTDLLDGYIARKYNLVSDFGKFMDQIADKILINALFIAFLDIHLIPGWFVAIIIVRDIFISGLRMFLANKNIVVAADMWGKLKTFSQTILIGSLYLSVQFSFLNSINTFLIWITAFFSIFSGYNYLVKNIAGFKGEENGQK